MQSRRVSEKMRPVLKDVLWIGNAIEARDYANLIALGITTIVDLADNEPSATPPRDMVLLRLPISDDGQNDNQRLRFAIDSIARLVQSRGEKILVACSAGLSRSPAIVAAALHLLGRGTLKECLEYVCRNAHCDVSPGLWNSIVTVSD